MKDYVTSYCYIFETLLKIHKIDENLELQLNCLNDNIKVVLLYSGDVSLNRLSGGKNRRKTKNRNPRISIITNNKAYYKNKNHRINTKRTTLRYNKVYAFLFLLVCIFCVLIMNNKADLFAYFTNYQKIIN